jgi:hypothetical protein
MFHPSNVFRNRCVRVRRINTKYHLLLANANSHYSKYRTCSLVSQKIWDRFQDFFPIFCNSKSGLVVSELDSQSKGCGFESRLIQILDGNGLKAMPGSIPAPNSGSFMEK